MALLARRSPLAPPPPSIVRRAVPPVSVMLGSLTAALPVVATAPTVPPFGFLMLLGWRLLRPTLWPAWVGIPLGAFDDLLSGQPLGSGIVLWTAALIGLDLIDYRLLIRTLLADWAISAAFVAALLLLSEGFAHITGPTPSPVLLLPQLLASILVIPLASRLCLWLDHRRLGRR